MRDKPILIAVSKVDALPLGVATPPEEVGDGTKLEPTAPGSPLDQFEESVRSWVAERFAQAGAGGAQAQSDPKLSGVTPDAEPQASVYAGDAHRGLRSDPVSDATVAEDEPPRTSEDGVSVNPAHLDPTEPPSDPLQADQLEPPTESNVFGGTAEHEPPSDIVIPAEPVRPSSDLQLDPSAISQRYWEVVCVSAVSL